MSISFQCKCGKQYELPESLLGKSIRCEECGDYFVVDFPKLEELVESEDFLGTNEFERPQEEVDKTDERPIPPPVERHDESKTGTEARSLACIFEPTPVAHNGTATNPQQQLNYRQYTWEELRQLRSCFSCQKRPPVL